MPQPSVQWTRLISRSKDREKCNKISIHSCLCDKNVRVKSYGKEALWNSRIFPNLPKKFPLLAEALVYLINYPHLERPVRIDLLRTSVELSTKTSLTAPTRYLRVLVVYLQADYVIRTVECSQYVNELPLPQNLIVSDVGVVQIPHLIGFLRRGFTPPWVFRETLSLTLMMPTAPWGTVVHNTSYNFININCIKILIAPSCRHWQELSVHMRIVVYPWVCQYWSPLFFPCRHGRQSTFSFIKLRISDGLKRSGYRWKAEMFSELAKKEFLKKLHEKRRYEV